MTLPYRVVLPLGPRLAPYCLTLALTPLGCGDDDDANADAADADGGETADETADESGDDDDDDDDDDNTGDDDDDDNTGDDDDDDDDDDDQAAAVEAFMQRLPGLWTAPVMSGTSVGDLPLMNMDVRPADDRTLFARVDLDAENSLRFAFAVEEDASGEPALVFRNGGYFLGILRDSRTTLQSYDDETGVFRFCSVTGGCDYVEAVFVAPGDDTLTLEVQVMGMFHIHWSPQRAEPRELDGAFPYDDTPGSMEDPFPTMPILEATLTLPEPASGGEQAWILLFTESCPLMVGQCVPSRFLRAPVDAGEDEVVLGLDQIHPGEYFALAILDRDGDLEQSLLPDTEDAVSLPNIPITVAPRGTSEATIDIMIEL